MGVLSQGPEPLHFHLLICSGGELQGARVDTPAPTSLEARVPQHQSPGASCSGAADPLPTQVFLTSPTEVAKVRLQTQTHAQTGTQAQTPSRTQRRPSASWPAAAPPLCPAPTRPDPGPKYRGPLHCLATVAREEGLRGLYKGSSALLLRDGHSFATYFLSYAILCEWLTPAGHSQPGEGDTGGRGPVGGELGRADTPGSQDW